jgi:hypothetical protein
MVDCIQNLTISNYQPNLTQRSISEYHAIFHEIFRKANDSPETREVLENMIYDLKIAKEHENDSIPHIFDPSIDTNPGAQISRPAKRSPL